MPLDKALFKLAQVDTARTVILFYSAGQTVGNPGALLRRPGGYHAIEKQLTFHND
jgi:hypothetical protein